MLNGFGYLVSAVNPRYTLHTTDFGDYNLHIKCDQLGQQGVFVYQVTDKQGKKVTEPKLPTEGLRISFHGGKAFVPLEVRLE